MAITNRFASEEYVANSISTAMENYLTSEELQNYAKTEDLNDFIKAENLENYAKTEDLNDFIKTDDLTDYAKASDLENYATTEFVNSDIDRVLSLTERVKSWGAVQYYVRNGQAPYIFNIGDQLVCNSDQFGELTWDIIGFDQDIPADSQYTHSMTLQLHTALSDTARDYDSKSFVYCTESDLSAGTYYFYYSTKVDKSTKTYLQLIIEDGITIPTGAKLYSTTSITNMSFVSDDFATTYWTGKLASKGTTTPTDGTILGEIDYYNIAQGGHYYYKDADIRAFLNGEDEVLSNWTPANNLQIPPAYFNSPGFLYQIDPEFKEVLGPVKKKIYNLHAKEIEEVEDLVFLPSGSEVYSTHLIGVDGNEINLGEPYDYYKLNSEYSQPMSQADDNRKKYDNTGSICNWYLRSPHAVNASTANNASISTRVQIVNSQGSVAAGYCTNNSSNIFLAPCCCIV